MSSGQEELERKRKRVEREHNDSTPGKSSRRSRNKKAKIQNTEGLEQTTGEVVGSDVTITAVVQDTEILEPKTVPPQTSGEHTKRRKRAKRTSAAMAPVGATSMIGAYVVTNEGANGLVSEANGNGTTIEEKQMEAPQVIPQEIQPSVISSMVKHKRSDSHRSGGTEKHQWTVSTPLSGVLLSVDPLFSLDEKYIILATEYGVQVYSTATSLLVTPLPVGSVSAYALSAANPDLLYVATRKGQISTWNWLEGQRLNLCTIDSQIVEITSMVADESGQDTIYTLDKGKKWMITAHKFGSKDEPTKSDLVTLLRHDRPIRSFKVLSQGAGVCATTDEGFVVGKRTSSSKGAGPLRDLAYTWREVKTAQPPTSFAVRTGVVSTTLKQAKRKGQAGAGALTVDVAVGGLTGCVYVYHDVFNKLDLNGPPSKSVESMGALTVRELHWHREPVGALAWSLDGNYVISGGRETVLVLWQLDTGKRQYLPNLESPIQALTVSPTGTSYAVRLGDNSVMVLSTSELKPTANIAGIQSLSTTGNNFPRALVKSVDSMSKEFRASAQPTKVNAFVNPRDSQQLVLAVPAHQAGGERGISAPYLQTFDIATARHISRQAMTRTNATNTTLGPEGNRIREPDIKHLQASSNGHWLATVDEWSPPLRDVADLSVDDEDALTNTYLQRDSQLRFWSWDTASAQWSLNSRITTPHTSISALSPGRVLALATDPSGLSFATLGEDSIVRIWAPTTTLASGRVVHGDARAHQPGSTLSWRKRFDIPLPRSSAPGPAATACLAYAADGTCLAAHQSFPAASGAAAPVYLIDAAAGRLHSARDNLLWRAASDATDEDDDDICALAFLEQCLIVAGQRAALVWDVTSWTSLAYITIPAASSSSSPSSPPHLAVDAASRTFALASAETHERSRLAVYSPFALQPGHDAAALFETVLPRQTLALLSAASASSGTPSQHAHAHAQVQGYVLLDADAVVRCVRPKGGRRGFVSDAAASSVPSLAAPAPAPLSPPPSPSPSSSSSSSSDINADTPIPPPPPPPLADTPAQTQVVIVRPEQLAELFEAYPSHAAPPMRELWGGVRELFVGVGGGGGF